MHDLREVFNGLRYVIKGGVTWRLVLNDRPPWEIVYPQAQRWLAADFALEARRPGGNLCQPSRLRPGRRCLSCRTPLGAGAAVVRHPGIDKVHMPAAEDGETRDGGSG